MPNDLVRITTKDIVLVWLAQKLLSWTTPRYKGFLTDAVSYRDDRVRP